MTRPRRQIKGDTQADLRRWAAYVLESQPRNILVRLGEIEDWHYYSDHQMFLEGLDRLHVAIKDLDEAIGVLAEGGCINSSQLHSYHLEKQRFTRDSVDIVDWFDEEIDLPSRVPEFDRAEGYWVRLSRISDDLLTSDDALSEWANLGRELGNFLLHYPKWDDPYQCTDRVQRSKFEAFKQILRLAKQLFDVASAEGLRGYAHRVLLRIDSNPGQNARELNKHDEHCRLGLSRLDELIRFALLREAPPRPVLVLDRDHPTLFGKPISIVAHRKEFAFLWVLAENADSPVERETIKKAVDTDRSLGDLKFIASGLRRLLRPIIEKHYRETDGSRLDYWKDSFIPKAARGGKGFRGGKDMCGPYILRLSPSRVSIGSERPDWMTPRELA